MFAGTGPTLLPRQDAYASRYLLRDIAVDGAADAFRHHPVRLRDGREVPRLQSVDLDELSLDTVEQYRLIVLRRSPLASRPPSNYELAWRGRWYDVWRRTGPAPLAHLPFGDELHAGDTPSCATLGDFAERHRDAELAAARARDAVIAGLPASRLPSGWSNRKRFPGAALASRSGTVELPFELPHGGRWRVWVGGAVLGRLTLTIDDSRAASIRHRMNRPREYEPVATVTLAPGRHRLVFDFDELLLDGINDRNFMGPVALTPVVPAVEPTLLPSRRVRSLCGERLDWIEAVPK
jgi:hypothetical protein